MPSRIWLFVTRRYTSQAQIGVSSRQRPLQATLAHPLAVGGGVDVVAAQHLAAAQLLDLHGIPSVAGCITHRTAAHT